MRCVFQTKQKRRRTLRTRLPHPHFLDSLNEETLLIICSLGWCEACGGVSISNRLLIQTCIIASSDTSVMIRCTRREVCGWGRLIVRRQQLKCRLLWRRTSNRDWKHLLPPRVAPPTSNLCLRPIQQFFSLGVALRDSESCFHLIDIPPDAFILSSLHLMLF